MYTNQDTGRNFSKRLKMGIEGISQKARGSEKKREKAKMNCGFKGKGEKFLSY